jgi:hypothetical protein
VIEQQIRRKDRTGVDGNERHEALEPPLGESDVRPLKADTDRVRT